MSLIPLFVGETTRVHKNKRPGLCPTYESYKWLTGYFLKIMDMKYQKLLSEFEGQLDQLDHGGGDILFRAEKGIVLVEKSIRALQKKVAEKPFPSKEDEIYFFKHVKPQILSKLIYYIKLFNIESKCPLRSRSSG